jgi:hypothetical protein
VPKRTDANHKQILSECRQIVGLTVFSTHEVGKGFPDIVVGYKGKNYLFEIKDGTKPPSARKLTLPEIAFHMDWKGQVNTVHSIEDILSVLNGMS